LKSHHYLDNPHYKKNANGKKKTLYEAKKKNTNQVKKNFTSFFSHFETLKPNGMAAKLHDMIFFYKREGKGIAHYLINTGNNVRTFIGSIWILHDQDPTCGIPLV
jgi:hypothetical protein